MPLILPGNVASATAAVTYSVANSCRFNDGDSPKMVKELGTPTDLDKWTISAWVKLGTLPIGTNRVIFQGHDDGSNYTGLLFTTAHNLEFGNRVGGTHVGRLITDREFRDPAAWYHVVAVWDSDNGTAGDRMKLYVNGVEETSFSTDTNPTSGEASSLESGHDAQISSHADGGYYMDGYMAEVCFIDGQALTPTSFGEFNSDSPTIWQPIDVSGLTFGNNGFYLDFEDSSNLGNDANGGTDFTETNIAAADSSTDTPTNNFCTCNPLDNYYFGATFSEGNCYVVTGASSYTYGTSTFYLTAGKWYWELKIISGEGAGASQQDFGITPAPNPDNGGTTWTGVGTDVVSWNTAISDGEIYKSGTAIETSPGSATTGDILSAALDLDNNKLYFAKNGVWISSQDPAAGSNGFAITAAASNPTGVYTPFFGDSGAGTATAAWNFGGCPAFAITSAQSDDNNLGKFEYDVPAGFLALCSKNLGSDGG